MTDENEPSSEEAVEKESVPNLKPAKRDASGDDAVPPMIAPARGPMDQTTPDVPTGSTPLTRHDD